jgi:hypothetical protein
MDWRVVAVAAISSVASLLLAAIVPIARFSRAQLSNSLMSPTTTDARPVVVIRKVTLAFHVAVTTVVLIAAVLFVRSVSAAFQVGPGFEPDRVAFVSIQTRQAFSAMPDLALRDRKARDTSIGFELIGRLQMLPGVRAVGWGAPTFGLDHERPIVRSRTVRTAAGEQDLALGFVTVGENYLDVLGIEPILGRGGLKDEVVVTPSLADILWPSVNPIGQRVTIGSETLSVAGIADMAFGSIRFGRAPGMLRYADLSVPTAINMSGLLRVVVQTDPNVNVVPQIEEMARGLFPDAPLIEVMPAAELVATDLGQERMGAMIFTGFGAVALFLAIVSVFNLVTYLIKMRSKEFAVRVALGAPRLDVASRALWGCIEPAMVGGAIGLFASVALSQWFESYLFGVAGLHVQTYAAVYLSMMLLTVTAGGFSSFKVLETSGVRCLQNQ